MRSFLRSLNCLKVLSASFCLVFFLYVLYLVNYLICVYKCHRISVCVCVYVVWTCVLDTEFEVVTNLIPTYSERCSNAMISIWNSSNQHGDLERRVHHHILCQGGSAVCSNIGYVGVNNLVWKHSSSYISPITASNLYVYKSGHTNSFNNMCSFYVHVTVKMKLTGSVLSVWITGKSFSLTVRNLIDHLRWLVTLI